MENLPLPSLSYLFMTGIKNDLQLKGLLSRVWTGCMDDILTTVRKDKVEEMMKVLKKGHLNFHFTFQIEDRGVFPFLDLKIIRGERGISYNIYGINPFTDCSQCPSVQNGKEPSAKDHIFRVLTS